MSNPKAVVVGYGFAGKCFHSYLVGLAPNLDLHGIASRDPETRKRAESERGCRTYESLEQVLDDPTVDLVVLATPNYVHADQAVQALEAGKHVVSDKVMALNLADCDHMIAAAERSGKMLTVFQNRRWDGDYLTLRQAMDDGLMGDLRWAEMAWQGFGAWGGWRGQKDKGGGKLYDLGAHLIDQLVMLFPQRIESVYAKLHYDLPATDTESQALVVVNFAGGATGICDTSSLAAISKPRFHAFGTGGTFMKHGLDPQEKAMIAADIDSAVEDPAHYATWSNGKETRTLTPVPGRWRNFYENVGDAIVGRAEPAVTLPSVRRAIGVIDAAFRSADTGQVIPVDFPAL